MPYKSISGLPKAVRDNLPKQAQRIWLRAFNSAFAKYKSDERAAKIAWGAVKNAGYKKNKQGKWVKSEDVESLLIQDGQIVILEEEGGEPDDGALRFEGTALIDYVLSKNNNYYTPSFNDALLEETNDYIERGGIVPMFSRHGKALPKNPWGIPDELHVGKVEELFRDGGRLRYKAQVIPTSEGSDVQKLIRHKALQATSVRISPFTSQSKVLEGREVQEMLTGRLAGIDFAIRAGIEGAGIDRVFEEAPQLQDIEEDRTMEWEDITIDDLREHCPDLLNEHVASYIVVLNEKIQGLEAENTELKEQEGMVSADELKQRDDKIKQLEFEKAVLDEAAKLGPAAAMATLLHERASTLEEVATHAEAARKDALAEFLKGVQVGSVIPPKGTIEPPDPKKGEASTTEEQTDAQKEILRLAR